MSEVLFVKLSTNFLVYICRPSPWQEDTYSKIRDLSLFVIFLLAGIFSFLHKVHYAGVSFRG